MIVNLNKCIDNRGTEYLFDIFNQISHAVGASSPLEAVGVFFAMMRHMEMLNPILEQKEKDLELLSSSVNPIRLKNNPVGLDKEIIYKLYEKTIIH